MGIFVVGRVLGCLWSFVGVIGNMVCRLSVFDDWSGIVVVGRWGSIISGLFLSWICDFILFLVCDWSYFIESFIS